ncbi:hypothetical protein BDW66DRAFT_30418 [Aspergillus desertorum]
MASLNVCSVLTYFPHSGVNAIANNTCHFGINNLFADKGLMDAEHTGLYFPADGEQMKAVVRKISLPKGTTIRLPVPTCCRSRRKTARRSSLRRLQFVPGKEEFICGFPMALISGL